MYSFYGGRPGNSFVIVAVFKSKDEMVQNFSDGPDYTAVHYDEYVMINTDNRNDEDNGKIYRRGYNFTDKLGGAEYVGCIAGPAGNAPALEFTTPSNIQDIIDHQGGTHDSNGSANTNSLNLVPGKYMEDDEEKFNDEITWRSCNLLDANGITSTVYVGLTSIPYTVIDFTTDTIGPYQESSVEQVGGYSNHPFYEKWKINIPKGIKGNSIENLTIETISENSNIIYPDGMDTTGIEEGDKVLVYNKRIYDDSKDGKIETQENSAIIKKYYCGQINEIKNVSVDDTGQLTINYTDNNTQPTVLPSKLKWIKEVSLTDEGILQFTWNDNTTSTSSDNNKIRWIEDVAVDPNTQKLKIQWNDDNNGYLIGEPINYIIDMTVTSNNHLLVKYSDPAQRQDPTEYTNSRNEVSAGWTDIGVIQQDTEIIGAVNNYLNGILGGTITGQNVPQIVSKSDLNELETEINADLTNIIEYGDLKNKLDGVPNDQLDWIYPSRIYIQRNNSNEITDVQKDNPGSYSPMLLKEYLISLVKSQNLDSIGNLLNNHQNDFYKYQKQMYERVYYVGQNPYSSINNKRTVRFASTRFYSMGVFASSFKKGKRQLSAVPAAQAFFSVILDKKLPIQDLIGGYDNRHINIKRRVIELSGSIFSVEGVIENNTSFRRIENSTSRMLVMDNKEVPYPFIYKNPEGVEGEDNEYLSYSWNQTISSSNNTEDYAFYYRMADDGSDGFSIINENAIELRICKYREQLTGSAAGTITAAGFRLNDKTLNDLSPDTTVWSGPVNCAASPPTGATIVPNNSPFLFIGNIELEFEIDNFNPPIDVYPPANSNIFSE